MGKSEPRDHKVTIHNRDGGTEVIQATATEAAGYENHAYLMDDVLCVKIEDPK